MKHQMTLRFKNLPALFIVLFMSLSSMTALAVPFIMTELGFNNIAESTDERFEKSEVLSTEFVGYLMTFETETGEWLDPVELDILMQITKGEHPTQ